MRLLSLLGFWGQGRGFRTMNLVEDLAPMDRDHFWRVNPQPHLVASNLDDRDRDVVADDNLFVSFAR